jgi:hypothetical protein
MQLNIKRYISINIVTVVVFFLLSIHSHSQSTLLNSKLNLQIGSSFVNTYSDALETSKNPLFYSSLSYRINDNFEAGLYIGYGSIMHQTVLPYNPTSGYYEWYSIDSTSYIKSNTSNGGSKSSLAINYGITCNVQLLPLILKKNIRFDLYLQPQFGFISEKYTVFEDFQKKIWSKPFLEYGISIGLKYNFTKHIGVFSDYSFGRYYNNQKSKMKLGLSIII